MGNGYFYFCPFPTCGHRATTLQNILAHLLDRHELWIWGMNYELDLVYDFFCVRGLVGFLEDLWVSV